MRIIPVRFRSGTGKTPKEKCLALRITAVILAAVVLITGIVVLGYYTFLPAKITLKVAQYFTLQSPEAG